ncbi:MAG TPA: MOSC domain-containing protein [archaeon]|nr:MOSC domain-containing protein [archaeon]
MNQKGKVVSISISGKKGIPKTQVEFADLVADWGIEGDAHAGDWPRQVSLLASESIEKMRRMGLKVSPGAFAENITTENIDLLELKVGQRLSIGEAELEVTQIGKECEHRCSVYYQVGDCVMPREGIFARVAKGGRIRAGDPLEAL